MVIRRIQKCSSRTNFGNWIKYWDIQEVDCMMVSQSVDPNTEVPLSYSHSQDVYRLVTMQCKEPNSCVLKKVWFMVNITDGKARTDMKMTINNRSGWMSLLWKNKSYRICATYPHLQCKRRDEKTCSWMKNLYIVNITEFNLISEKALQ